MYLLRIVKQKLRVRYVKYLKIGEQPTASFDKRHTCERWDTGERPVWLIAFCLKKKLGMRLNGGFSGGFPNNFFCEIFVVVHCTPSFILKTGSESENVVFFSNEVLKEVYCPEEKDLCDHPSNLFGIQNAVGWPPSARCRKDDKKDEKDHLYGAPERNTPTPPPHTPTGLLGTLKTSLNFFQKKQKKLEASAINRIQFITCI